MRTLSGVRPEVEAEAVVDELFHTPEGRRDPHPLYRRLRELAPVHRSDAVRAWLLTGYDDCHSALRDPRLQKRYEEAMDARSSRWRGRPSLVWRGRTLPELDGSAHTRLRRQVHRAFTPRTVEQLRPAVEAIIQELLDTMAASGGGDVMEQLAFPLPVQVIGRLLGVPSVDLPPFRDHILALTTIFEVGASPEVRDAADAAMLDCTDYFTKLIADKRAQPSDDLLSRLATGEGSASPDDRLDDEELNTLALLLFMAGFETTTNLVGSGVLALLDHPDQLCLLRDHPDSCVGLVDELLRYCGTVQVVNRYTTEPITFGEVTIPGGEQVFLMLGAANRDPLRYADPDRLDLTRTDIHPLSFGGGVHFCLGAALARLEIDVAFRRLVERFDLIELQGARLPHRDRLSLRGPASVPLTLGRRGPVAASAAPGTASRPNGDDRSWRDAFRHRLENAATCPDPVEVRTLSALLGRIALFAPCRPTELARLAATAYPIAFDQGDALCVQGDDTSDCYVVVEGEAAVTIDGEPIGVVRCDEVVGERAPIERRPRSATVIATTHMLAYAISRERLDELLVSRPDVAAHMRMLLQARYSGELASHAGLEPAAGR
jgi:cytochrome P450